VRRELDGRFFSGDLNIIFFPPDSVAVKNMRRLFSPNGLFSTDPKRARNAHSPESDPLVLIGFVDPRRRRAPRKRFSPCRLAGIVLCDYLS